MDKELKSKIESLKSDGKKKKSGCASCKKKKVAPIELPDPIDIENIYIPTKEDIVTAYLELGNRVEDKSQFINKVYVALFGEEFNFGCTSCVNAQSRRLRNYIIDALQMPL